MSVSLYTRTDVCTLNVDRVFVLVILSCIYMNTSSHRRTIWLLTNALHVALLRLQTEPFVEYFPD